MKTPIFNHNGEKIKEIEMPSFFSARIREDLISKVLESLKKKQPYSPSPVAGKQHAARGKVQHRRHVWRSGYGKGISRVPRKIMSRRGEQFNWEAAEIPGARGGLRAHPPYVIGMQTFSRINKKEMRIAFISALSSTANSEEIKSRYKSLEGKKIEHALPLIISELKFKKTKEMISAMKKILGNTLFEIAMPKKKTRSGRGKFRGRKYRKSAGLLIVTGNNEEINSNVFETARARELNVQNLEMGRLTLYTEKAIKELEERLK
ncbi:MAG TPA: 50S ribosomal protein L4 [Candidatus Omnitrophota bacterium]|nr:50S ribosomal protein L4 [Candidatus Omnitrophota bacterium]